MIGKWLSEGSEPHPATLDATTASPQVGYYPYAYYQDPYSAHPQAEHEHMAGERHHLWHERNARDDALSRGIFWVPGPCSST